MKKIKFLCVWMFMMVGAMVGFAQNGTIGDNLNWSLDGDGTLTISGTGAMWDGNFEEDPNGFFYPNALSIKTVVIENGVTTIGRDAFYGCDNLASIDIPESVESIGNGAFIYCSKLTSIVIPEGVKSIGEAVFHECSNLVSVSIPGTVNYIDNWAFGNCVNLTSVTIAEGVSIIGNIAFEYCSKLTSIIIPQSVVAIGDGAFAHSGLTSIIIPEGITSIGVGTFAQCNDLTSISIPKSVISIGAWAFIESGLTSVTIPNNVRSIKEGTFDNCLNLTSVTIPSHVNSIGDWAFRSCLSLTSITNLNPNPVEIDANVFEEVNKSACMLTVPKGSLDSYKDALVWQDFLIIEGTQEPKPECVMINGVCWATRNVDAPNTLAENPEDAGMFYQWNRAVGWSATDHTPVGWVNFTPPGNTWEITNNVCPNGFRLPTREEQQSLIDAGSVWTSLNGVNGRQFGTEPNTIFLPAAGCRLYNYGIRDGAGSYARYWSSTQYGSSLQNEYFILSFNSGHANWNYYSGTNGFSVRCVASDFTDETAIETIKASSVKVYPNPTTGIVNIEAKGESILKVYNPQGALLLEKTGNNVDLSTYPQGLYLLQINNAWTKVIKK